MVHYAHFGKEQLGTLEMLNALANSKSENIFPNISVSSRMSLTAPATAALAERSFSKLKHKKLP